MRYPLILVALVIAVLNAGCSLLPPQQPIGPHEEQVTSFRGGTHWTAPGGLGPEFWAKP